MGLFDRIKALFKGFVGTTAEKIEAKNPQLLINEAEQKIQKSRRAAEKQLVEIQTWAETVRLEAKEAEIRLEDIKVKIEMAAQEKNKQLLTELFIAQEQAAGELEEKNKLHSAAVSEALRVRDNFKRFETEMHNRLRELDAIKTQSEIVAMREKISEMNYIGTNEYDNSINAVRRSLNKRCAKIAAMEQLGTSDVNNNIREIADKAAYKRAEAKAEALLNMPIVAEIQEFR